MQGFNMGRYVPPDLEGTITGTRLHNKRAAPATVRFEMPFPVWCATCPRPTLIPQGVRFNAEKRRVGAYFSTPVWAFRLRHVACGGALEIRTDPRNTAYVVAEGGTRRDHGAEHDAEQDALLRATGDAREALRGEAFAKLEKTIADREMLKRAEHRINGLLEDSERRWADPYAQNQRLRKAFRVGRHEREREAAVAADLRDRMSLAINLIPAQADDATRAALVNFAPDEDYAGAKALAKPLFSRSAAKHSTRRASKRSKTSSQPRHSSRSARRSDTAQHRTHDSLVAALRTNTRAAQDPFLKHADRNARSQPAPAPSTRLTGVERKREAVATASNDGGLSPQTKSESADVAVKASSNSLVQYDSE